jgi:hypothetical protein
MSWELTGNGNIGLAAFLGTTDQEPLVIKTHNKEALRVNPTGNVGIGTPVPVSILEANVPATGTLGPSLTLTNPGGGLNAAAAIDFNTFSSSSGTYNPSSRIEGVDDGNFANDIVFLSNRPGAPNHGLVEIMRITPSGMKITQGAGDAVVGNSGSGRGLVGVSNSQAGVVGDSQSFDGVFGVSRTPTHAGVSGHNLNPDGSVNPNGLAGFFDGNVVVTGDVILQNADCAEDFDVAALEGVEPGSVMIIGDDSALRQSEQAYDKRVAGVVSGGGAYKPGIVLDRHEPADNRKSIALLGKFYCKVDASREPIEVGDLLTTSPTPGRAMKATDPVRAFGAVIGKALRSLRDGHGLIPILVALQ